MAEDIKFDFDKNIRFLLESKLEDYIENDIVVQNNIMNSNNFNTTFKYIEDSLNFLYEKNRVLEDVIKYSNLFLKNEISNTIAECKSIFSLIEEDRDLIKNNNYIKYSVPFSSSTNAYMDRNNLAISNAVIYDNNLTLNSTIINSYKPTNIETIKDLSNNITKTSVDMLTDNSYRSFYMFENIKGKDIEETICIVLDSPSKINKINFNFSNCFVDEISFILDDDSNYSIKNNMGLFNTVIAKQINIKIKSNNYIMSQVNYNDYISTNNDFWKAIDAINDDENLIIDAKKYYYYLFGIDNLSFEYVLKEDQSCFYSKEINIGKLSDNEYLSIDTIDSIERGNIEYYIVDGTNLIPILPEKVSTIIDEKIFYKVNTRFPYDTKFPIKIKCNGNEVDLTIQEAMNKNEVDSVYTASYTPIANNIKDLKHSSIKIKAIIRTYDKNFNSFIHNINIKKYGGGKLWIDKI